MIVLYRILVSSYEYLGGFFCWGGGGLLQAYTMEWSAFQGLRYLLGISQERESTDFCVANTVYELGHIPFEVLLCLPHRCEVVDRSHGMSSEAVGWWMKVSQVINTHRLWSEVYNLSLPLATTPRSRRQYGKTCNTEC